MEVYLKVLDEQPDEYSKLIDSILINVTQFFRDPEAWEIIKNDVIPQIISKQEPRRPNTHCERAGCASGAEAYPLQ